MVQRPLVAGRCPAGVAGQQAIAVAQLRHSETKRHERVLDVVGPELFEVVDPLVERRVIEIGRDLFDLTAGLHDLDSAARMIAGQEGQDDADPVGFDLVHASHVGQDRGIDEAPGALERLLEQTALQGMTANDVSHLMGQYVSHDAVVGVELAFGPALLDVVEQAAGEIHIAVGQGQCVGNRRIEHRHLDGLAGVDVGSFEQTGEHGLESGLLRCFGVDAAERLLEPSDGRLEPIGGEYVRRVGKPHTLRSLTSWWCGSILVSSSMARDSSGREPVGPISLHQRADRRIVAPLQLVHDGQLDHGALVVLVEGERPRQGLAGADQIVFEAVHLGQLDVGLGQFAGLGEVLDCLGAIVVIRCLDRGVDQAQAVVTALISRLGSHALLVTRAGLGHRAIDLAHAGLGERGVVGHLGVVNGQGHGIAGDFDAGALDGLVADAVSHPGVHHVPLDRLAELFFYLLVALAIAFVQILENQPAGLGVALIGLEDLLIGVQGRVVIAELGRCPPEGTPNASFLGLFSASFCRSSMAFSPACRVM